MIRNKVKFSDCVGIEFYIDEENQGKIFIFLKGKSKERLRYIFSRICKGKPPTDVYSSENYSDNIKNVTAIKFKGRKFNNARIYCKDYNDRKPRIIVLSELLTSKKNNKLKHGERNLIKKVNNYDY